MNWLFLGIAIVSEVIAKKMQRILTVNLNNIVKLVVDNYSDIFNHVAEKQQAAREFYERQFGSEAGPVS